MSLLMVEGVRGTCWLAVEGNILHDRRGVGSVTLLQRKRFHDSNRSQKARKQHQIAQKAVYNWRVSSSVLFSSEAGGNIASIIKRRQQTWMKPLSAAGWQMNSPKLLCDVCREDVRASAVRGQGESKGEEQDVVPMEEMEQFLDSLSLEYESVWDTKPAWCQPWTIALTGALGIAGSWQLLHWPILTGFVSVLVFLWWYIFLYSYPKAYSELVAERRRLSQLSKEDF